MENNALTDILKQLQDKLSDMLNCKSEIRSTENDALLYGKFPIDNSKYTVVIHLAPENFVPVTAAQGKIDVREDTKATMPSLKFQVMSASKGNCSAEENDSIRTKFINEVSAIYKNSKYGSRGNSIQ